MPIVSELDAAMMQPALSVPAVRRLGGGTIRLDDAGRPVRATGRDAVVYELRAPDGRILALRCLLRQDPARDRVLAERYAALGSDRRLEPLRGAGGALPRSIRWIEEGVALTGPDFRSVTAPVIAMERIPGRTLIRAVDRLCHEGQDEPLALLADAWLATASALEDVGFTHGDLAADNLLVRPDGTIALVDLDTALWPAAGVAPGHAGTSPAYAHPRGAPLAPGRGDRFPALIIWASMRILARQPALRERWGEDPERLGAGLLWTQEDLRHPGRSGLFTTLDELHDETLAPLVEIVRRAIRFSPDDTPPLPEIAQRLEVLGLPAHAARRSSRRGWTPVVVPSPEPPSGRGESGLPAVRDSVPAGDDSLIFAPPWRSADTAQTTTIAERERRLAAAQELKSAVDARDTSTALRLWEASRTAPESAAHVVSLHDLVSRDVSAAIERALRRGDDDALLVAIAEAERAGVAPPVAARSAARAARARVAARTALQAAIRHGELRELASLARSGELECLGRLEPAPARAVEQALAWPSLERALASDDDTAIAVAADPALWREEGALPGDVRERVALARGRLRWVEDVRKALRLRDEPALRGLLATAPPGAEKRLTEVESRRILRLSMREAAVSRLERALREGPDREVVAALTEFESAGAPFSDVLDWTAVRGVVDRISLGEALRAAATANPPDTARIARLLPAARAALSAGGADAPDWATLERSVLRAAHVARLRDAIAANDDARILAAAVPDPYGALQVLAPEERQRVEHAPDHAAGRGPAPIVS